MIARLQLFYGGDAGAWHKLPLALLQAYTASIPMLRAEASLMRVQEIAIGTGSAKKEDSKRQLSTWQRAAVKRGNVIKPTPEERDDMIRAAGIQIG